MKEWVLFFVVIVVFYCVVCPCRSAVGFKGRRVVTRVGKGSKHAAEYYPGYFKLFKQKKTQKVNDGLPWR